MARIAGSELPVEQIRTIGFLLATVPLMILTALLSVLTLVVCMPLMAYSIIIGEHLKDPWKNKQRNNYSV
jgi:hypothetical protein